MEEKLNQTHQQVAETKVTKTKKVNKKIKLPIKPPYPPYNETKLIAALEEVATQMNLLCQTIRNSKSNGGAIM